MPAIGIPMIGTTLTLCQITGELGQGGRGDVYRAKDTTPDRGVPIKIPPPEVGEWFLWAA